MIGAVAAKRYYFMPNKTLFAVIVENFCNNSSKTKKYVQYFLFSLS